MLKLTAGPYYQTEYFRKKGVLINNTLQNVDGMTFYPSDVLAPLSFTGLLSVTENTYSIHHFAATWFDDIQLENKKKYQQKYAELLAKIEG